jgi:hypothetical protein
MSVPAELFAPEVKLGRDAGWLLSFHRERGLNADPDFPFELSRDEYYAEISATLPSGLEGGTYTFVIEGLTDDDYARISQNFTDAPSIVKLHLYWRDLEAPDGGIGTRLLGADFINGFQKVAKSAKHEKDLIATLRIVSVARKVGTRRYETTIVARELVFDRLESRRPCGAVIELKDPEAAIKELMRRVVPAPKPPDPSEFPSKANLPPIPAVELPHQFHALSPRKGAEVKAPESEEPAKEDKEAETVDARQSIAASVIAVAKRLEEKAGHFGRGMLLIRDGTLHVGQRPIPLTGVNQRKELTLGQGLIEVEALPRAITDPSWDPCAHEGQEAPTRAQYRLTLRGRPDIKPGDVVVFEAPPGEGMSTKSPLGGALGSIGDLGAGTIAMFTGKSPMTNPIHLYVAGVDHKLGRAVGFTTKVTGVEIKGDTADDIWDAHTPADKKDDKKQAQGKAAKGTVEEEAADAVLRLCKREIANLGAQDIAEVRSFQAASDGAKGAQTSHLQRGLTPSIGPNAAHRADIERVTKAEVQGVPYLTPFAWGKCGLVLPRYPGMRVALNYTGFDKGDPIDVGAFWQKAHGPEEAKAGDWWLSLPAEAPAGNAPEAGTPGAPVDYTGKTTHDLIDTHGNRVIEVGALVVRVGSSTLKSAGKRPADPPQADSVSIECAGGQGQPSWKLQIEKDGTILLFGKKVTIKADDELTLDAPKVTVNCNSMDVP